MSNVFHIPPGLRQINIETASRTASMPTGDWRWIHLRGVGGGGGGGGSSANNSRAGQSGGGGGGFDVWLSRESYEAWLASIVGDVTHVDCSFAIGAAGAAGTATGDGGAGTTTQIILIAMNGLIVVATKVVATATAGQGGRVGNNAALLGEGGTATIDTIATGVGYPGGGGWGRGTLNAETGVPGGSSMFGGGGNASAPDVPGNQGRAYGSGGGSGARATVSAAGGVGAQGVVIMEVYD